MARNYRATKPGRPNKQPMANLPDAELEDGIIDLRGLFYQLMDHLKFIVALSLLGAIIMGVATAFFITPKYKTASKIYVLNAGDAAINLADLQIGAYLTADYQEVFENWIVHERVIQALDLPYSYSELSGMLTVTNPANTRILYIAVSSPDPKEAKAIADTYAKVAQEFIATTMDIKEPNLFEEALLPTAPFYPSKTKNVSIGFLAGLLLSCGFITLRFFTGDKIRTSEDIERYVGLPTLGVFTMQAHSASGKQQHAKVHKEPKHEKPKRKRSVKA